MRLLETFYTRVEIFNMLKFENMLFVDLVNFCVCLDYSYMLICAYDFLSSK